MTHTQQRTLQLRHELNQIPVRQRTDLCGRPTCSHQRQQHRPRRLREILHSQPCTFGGCRCPDFQEALP